MPPALHRIGLTVPNNARAVHRINDVAAIWMTEEVAAGRAIC